MSLERRECECHNTKVRLEILVAVIPLIVAGTAWLVSLQSDVEAERAFSRSICNEVRRLTQELGKVPANDCNRP